MMKENESCSVLIVEDEVHEEEMLEDMIRNNYPQVTAIYSADNGIDALTLVQEKNPDIVLLDINIPGITGTDLMRELSENHFQGQIVITTAYDYFDYAKQAVRYGAAGYLLKPIMDDELDEYMQKCFHNIFQMRRSACTLQRIDTIFSYAQKYLMKDLLDGQIPEKILSGVYGWPPEGRLQMRLVRIHFQEVPGTDEQREIAGTLQEAANSYFRTMQMMDGRDFYLLLQPENHASYEELEVAAWCVQAVLICHLEKIGADYLMGMQVLFSEVCQTYGALLDEMSHMVPLHVRVNLGDETNVERERRISKSIQRMKEGNARRAVGIFHTLLDDTETLWGGVFLVLKAVVSFQSEIDVMDGFLSVTREKPVESLTGWLESELKALEGNVPLSDSVTKDALLIMNEEFGSYDLTQTSLAQRFGLNSAYFSRKFKKETGENFSTAMTRIRMEHAKAWLDEKIRPEQVCEMSGYTNRNYFYKAFKNYYGISPSQYAGRS